MLKKLDKFHKTKLGYFVFGLVELGVAYVIAGLALDTGNFFYYLLAFILLAGTIKNLSKLIGLLFNDKKPRRSR